MDLTVAANCPGVCEGEREGGRRESALALERKTSEQEASRKGGEGE